MTPKEKLDKEQIVYEEKSATHYVVEGNIGFIDYWPTTGKWICRMTRKQGFGAENLCTYIKTSCTF